ncbi:hypothetical protein CCACVL1_20548 [Corchorus capsularis]|uniref:Uncharacterized protein n=1 Tax=Corchorus capsularis TaxID=210143 RepID=A0A1R3HAN6_COCAP|nr:hypothetical protein CCACVL1_20548 [Corchorus capsularis]
MAELASLDDFTTPSISPTSPDGLIANSHITPLAQGSTKLGSPGVDKTASKVAPRNIFAFSLPTILGLCWR